MYNYLMSLFASIVCGIYLIRYYNNNTTESMFWIIFFLIIAYGERILGKIK